MAEPFSWTGGDSLFKNIQPYPPDKPDIMQITRTKKP
jgi:hypothetical protein